MDHERITRRAGEINSENTVRELGTRTRGAVIAYFDGDDLTGKIHTNTNTYAAFIAVVTDTGAAGFRQHQNKRLATLREELGDAFKDAGFSTAAGDLSIPGRPSYDEIPGSIGPVMPAILAILDVEQRIDSTQAVRDHYEESLQIIRDDEDQQPVTHEDTDRDWGERLRNAPGFDPDADAYVYVLELERLSDSSTWYYVGKREGRFADLRDYIRSHARNFTRSRVINHDGTALLHGDYSTAHPPQGTTHQVVDVERLVPISEQDLTEFDGDDVETSYIAEIERRTAYKVALDHDTTNVLGGK
jgi:hypothetical protein